MLLQHSQLLSSILVNKLDYDEAVVEQTNANTALNAEDGPQAAYDSAVQVAQEAVTDAGIALTASNTEARKEADVAANDLAQGALQGALNAIANLGSNGSSVTTVDQAAIIAQARLAAETAALRLN